MNAVIGTLAELASQQVTPPRPHPATIAAAATDTAGVNVSVRLDGSTDDLPAQNITGHWLRADQRVMCLLTPPHLILVIGAQGQRFNRGVFTGTTDAGGNVVVPHGLGAVPVAVNVTLTTGSTAGTIQVAQPAIGGLDATNFAVLFIRSDTGAALASNAIVFMWIAAT